MNLGHFKEWINKFQTTRQHTRTQQQGLQALLLDLETSKPLVQQVWGSHVVENISVILNLNHKIFQNNLGLHISIRHNSFG